MVDIEFTELDLSGRPREEVVGVPKEVVLIDWDGEDDPENPLNWCVPSHSYTVFTALTIGATEAHG